MGEHRKLSTPTVLLATGPSRHLPDMHTRTAAALGRGRATCELSLKSRRT